MIRSAGPRTLADALLILKMNEVNIDARRAVHHEAAHASASEPTVACAPAASRIQRQIDALFLLNSLTVGGSEMKTVRMANALTSRGLRTGIAYLNGPEDLRSALRPEIPVWHLRRQGKLSLPALHRLRGLIREQRPRTILSVNLYPALYLSLASTGSPSRHHSVALLNTTILPAGQAWKKGFYLPFLRRMDRVVYGCQSHRAEWATPAIFPKSGVIYNGVDTERFLPDADRERSLAERAARGVAPDAFVFGTVGRLAPEKNQRVLIEALCELRDRGVPAHLLLVGEGRERAELERQVDQAGMRAHVTFAGAQKDVRPLLSMMDVFVLPSSRVETFSNAALEAMAMQVPVVLSRIGGANEMVRDGIDGYTLDIDELSSALTPLLIKLQGDERLRSVLGRRARERVEREFSFESMVNDYVALIAARGSSGGD